MKYHKPIFERYLKRNMKEVLFFFQNLFFEAKSPTSKQRLMVEDWKIKLNALH